MFLAKLCGFFSEATKGMSELYFLPAQKLESLLARMIEDNLIYIPVVEQERAHFKRFRPGESFEWALDRIRPVEPLKGFFMKFKEVVAKPGGSLEKKSSKSVILGPKACDLRAMEVHDKVFLAGEFVDPFYKERRENTILISVDCPQPEPTCFCNLVGIQPHPLKGFDLNLTPMNSGFLAETGSEKGAELVRHARILFQPPSPEQIKERDTQRAQAVKTVEATNPKALEDNLSRKVLDADMEFWERESTTCVECCACLHICPTCYCFLLYDQKDDGGSERVRVWDACYYAAYARVGGGANPRADFSRRFRNRFLCKYSYFPGYHGFFACSGCGRCISGCTAKIDIREVLWGL